MKALTTGYDGLASIRFADVRSRPGRTMSDGSSRDRQPTTQDHHGYLRGRVDFALPHVLGRMAAAHAKIGSAAAAPGDEVTASPTRRAGASGMCRRRNPRAPP